MNTSGGAQQVSFLTEKGLYKVLFRSRKHIDHKYYYLISKDDNEIKKEYELIEENKNKISILPLVQN
jgi:hypothetical protein